MIKGVASKNGLFDPDLTKSLLVSLARSIDILCDVDANKFHEHRSNVIKFAIGFLRLQKSFQRFSRDLQIDYMNFLAKLAQCDPLGHWAYIQYDFYEFCSHNDERMDVVHEDSDR